MKPDTPTAPTSIAPTLENDGFPVVPGFTDRRRSDRDASQIPGGSAKSGGERRQFGSTHFGLSEAGRELALAIDHYKVSNRRRYLTCDEILGVIRSLGYDRPSDRSTGDA